MQTFWYRRLLLRDSSVLIAEETAAGGGVTDGKRDKAEADGGGDASASAGETASQAGGSAAVAKTGGGESYKRLMNLLMQLRKVCNHPYMFPDAEPDYDGTSTGEDIVEGSGKLKVSARAYFPLSSAEGGAQLGAAGFFVSWVPPQGTTDGGQAAS